MKFRYHLLMLLFAAAVTAGVWQWLTLPIWHATGFETVQYSGKNLARKELYSLVSENEGQSWSMETRDYWTGDVKRRLPLEISKGKGNRRWLFTPESCDIAESKLVYVEYDKHAEPTFRTLQLDGATGRYLPQGVFSDRLTGSQIARQEQNLAIAFKNEVRLYRNKNDHGRF